MPDFPEIRTVLGFDFGTRKFGVATGQRITATASPLPPIPSRDGIPDWVVVDKLVAEWQPQALLVGLPRAVPPLPQIRAQAGSALPVAGVDGG